MASLSYPRRKTAALTLAEVIIAIGLLSMVLLMLVGVFIGGLQLMARSEVHTEASSIGREVIETIEDEGGFSALPSSMASFDGAVPHPKLDGFPPDPYPKATRGGREYIIRVEVRSPSSRLGAVLVTVKWNEGQIKLEKVFHAADSVL